MMPKPIVTVKWLAEHLDDENLRIVDIRGHVLPASEPPPHYFSHLDDYKTAHIPSALFVDWTSDIVEPNSPTYDVANPDRYAKLMSQLGISNESKVVVYDDANSMFAARFWWTMRYYGHEDVAVLDGGWQAWIAGDYPVDDAISSPESATFIPRINDSLKANRADIETDQHQLIDVRSPAEFTGTASRANRTGHIPNAINIPRKTLLNEQGLLKSKDVLVEMFDDLGITQQSEDIILYCNSGVSASYGLLALQVAGITKGRVYDSSWKEWGNEEDTIIE